MAKRNVLYSQLLRRLVDDTPSTHREQSEAVHVPTAKQLNQRHRRDNVKIENGRPTRSFVAAVIGAFAAVVAAACRLRADHFLGVEIFERFFSFAIIGALLQSNGSIESDSMKTAARGPTTRPNSKVAKLEVNFN